MKLSIHGGCGAIESSSTTVLDYHEHLLPIIQKSYAHLLECNDAVDQRIIYSRSEELHSSTETCIEYSS